jgi:hypothetical protein
MNWASQVILEKKIAVFRKFFLPDGADGCILIPEDLAYDRRCYTIDAQIPTSDLSVRGPGGVFRLLWRA